MKRLISLRPEAVESITPVFDSLLKAGIIVPCKTVNSHDTNISCYKISGDSQMSADLPAGDECSSKGLGI